MENNKMNEVDANQPNDILLVDDDPVNLRLLSELLSGRGFKTRLMPSGKRALAAISRSLPDLILLDIMMPDMDGYEVCRQLKADERTKDIPIIFISALDDIFNKVKAFKLGAVDYITKPFNEAEVYNRVQTHLSLQTMVREIQAKNKLLERQNQELDAYSHIVAHDLKTPIGTIIGYTIMLKDVLEDLQNDYMQTCIDGISVSSFRMNRIIDELLLLAKIRQEEVRLQTIDMNQVLTRVLQSLEFTIQRYDGEISLPTSWHPAKGYAPWIEEVWVNYITNGLKYGGQPPHLQLGSSQLKNGMLSFWIRDNGDGLTREEQTVLFDEFTQLNSLHFSGHGLGLSIVKRIIIKLDGQVGVESNGIKGEGSLFYFTLPAAENGAS
jgi:two-component system, sensor histidine kinase and response regulator